MKILSSDKGFTLIEMILSIMILAIVSGVVIQLFVVSQDLGDRAKEADYATFTASNAMEVVKSVDDPGTIMNHEFFREADVVDGDVILLQLFYDEDYQVTTKANASYILSVYITEQEAYTKSLDARFDAEGQVVESSLCDIRVTYYKLEEEDSLLTIQSSSHYYTYVR
ncbi:MAG: type II secretion system protein [Vallitaleaceae bacterium]|jgi:prepilin-type N-terminal cleavage/methylation domain-containing protein|nr:type II secretion system protein [Vallitaleaceae bacterium]